ncbi:cyclic lactone autoinducer peptide [Listeria booriae]|uniref:Cyclic lactone autoinducer peptide n=1 Tax=Listeria booriae TaxID=1552123 RepID=A0A842B6T9_9LIST|nr:cyclic lactone autoinducer peptide [Listeria booriae]MBC1797545.1 cyclic lactone autoinducer peptide [Listeria booriae]MBC2195997.1 cyclic lactone autoinducer peptide [Listeria booriae]
MNINKKIDDIYNKLGKQAEEMATNFAEKSTKNCCLAFLYEPEVPRCLSHMEEK